MSKSRLNPVLLVLVLFFAVAFIGALFNAPKPEPEVAPAKMSINATRAGAAHIQTTERLPPDDTPEDPSADNYYSAQTQGTGTCQAKSQFEDFAARGGFTPSNNFPQKVQSELTTSGLSLVAQPGVALTESKFQCMRVSLINNTENILTFSAVDSCLRIRQEAQDADGKWKPIERMRDSSCGNSYHTVFLAPKYFWAFTALRYQGAFPTKLRFSMTLEDGSCLLSNTFDGSVNPEQFKVNPVENGNDVPQ